MMFANRILAPSERAVITSVAGVYDALESAEEAMRVLDSAGFPIGQITLLSPNREGPGFLATGALAVALLGDIEGVLYQRGAAAWLRQLMAWGVPQDAIHNYEKQVRAGRAVLVAHGGEPETACALRLLGYLDALELRLHAMSRTEWELNIRRG